VFSLGCRDIRLSPTKLTPFRGKNNAALMSIERPLLRRSGRKRREEEVWPWSDQAVQILLHSATLTRINLRAVALNSETPLHHRLACRRPCTEDCATSSLSTCRVIRRDATEYLSDKGRGVLIGCRTIDLYALGRLKTQSASQCQTRERGLHAFPLGEPLIRRVSLFKARLLSGSKSR